MLRIILGFIVLIGIPLLGGCILNRLAETHKPGSSWMPDPEFDVEGE